MTELQPCLPLGIVRRREHDVLQHDDDDCTCDGAGPRETTRKKEGVLFGRLFGGEAVRICASEGIKKTPVFLTIQGFFSWS